MVAGAVTGRCAVWGGGGGLPVTWRLVGRPLRRSRVPESRCKAHEVNGDEGTPDDGCGAWQRRGKETAAVEAAAEQTEIGTTNQRDKKATTHKIETPRGRFCTARAQRPTVS